MSHATSGELAAGTAHVLASPSNEGRVVLVVRRPAEGEREVLEEAMLDPALGLEGDDWLARRERRNPGVAPDPEAQLTVMNSRVVDLVAGEPGRRPLAGDQLYVDLDLGEVNLPAGTRLRVGEAVIEVSATPHTGCQKFTDRFGLAALRWTKTDDGRRLRLRGLNARVIEAGAVRPGDAITKL
ncbi:MAG TPA: MOSC domain-containing protein [Acidimicrobiia bacterium]|nr:MOSC domain-containing protein [Acidimicrobiia bacterium]